MVVDQFNLEYIYINIFVRLNIKDVELDEKKLDMVNGGILNGFLIIDYESLYDFLCRMYK